MYFNSGKYDDFDADGRGDGHESVPLFKFMADDRGRSAVRQVRKSRPLQATEEFLRTRGAQRPIGYKVRNRFGAILTMSLLEFEVLKNKFDGPNPALAVVDYVYNYSPRGDEMAYRGVENTDPIGMMVNWQEVSRSNQHLLPGDSASW